jgi:hypothetical protein
MVFMDKEKYVEPVKSHHPQDYSVEECECNQAIDLNIKEDRVENCYMIIVRNVDKPYTYALLHVNIQ